MAFVINMDRDRDKWKAMKHAFGPTCLKLTRIPAIHGGHSRMHSSVTPLCQLLCTNTMIGCFLSHQTLWKRIVDHQLPQAIIFEDDVKPCLHFNEKLDNLIIPSDFDLFLLGYHGDEEQAWYTPLRVYSQLLKQPLCYKKINETTIRPPFASGTHGYIVSLKGARKLLQYLPTVEGHVDLRMYSCPLTIYAAESPLVHINTTKIQGEETHTSVNVWQMLLHLPWFQLGSHPVNVYMLVQTFILVGVVGILLPKYRGLLKWFSLLVFAAAVSVWYRLNGPGER